MAAMAPASGVERPHSASTISIPASSNDNHHYNENQTQLSPPSAKEACATGLPLAPSISNTLGPNPLQPTTTTTTSTLADDDFPDGGYTAWSVVFGGWCIFICTFGIINCAGIFVSVYHTTVLSPSIPVSTITWIPALQACTMDVSTAIWGRAFDSYGHRWLLYPGVVVFIIGLMMISLCTEYWQLILTQGILAGLGASCVGTTTMTCIMTWFKRRRATALGIAWSGSALGGVVMPIMLTQLIDRIGFPWAMRTIAFLYLGLCAIGCVLVKSRLRPKPQPLLLKDYTAPFREGVMAWIFAGCFLFFGGMFVPFSYIVVQAQAAGVDAQLVAFILPIMSACSIPGRVIPGVLADRIGRFNTAMLFLGVSGVWTLAIWVPGVHSTPALLVFGALYGMTSGAIFGLTPAIIGQVSKIREIGTRTGIAFALGGVGVLVSPPIAGTILESMGGNYLGLQIFCAAEMLAGMACFAMARFMLVGVKWVKV